MKHKLRGKSGGIRCLKCGKLCYTEVGMWQHIVNRHPVEMMQTDAFQKLIYSLQNQAFAFGQYLGEALAQRKN